MSSRWPSPSKVWTTRRSSLHLGSVPAMDVMRAEAEVSKRDQELTVARTNLQLQESLIKNALTKSLDDPVLEEMPVVPTDRTPDLDSGQARPILDLITEALHNRPELAESEADLDNRQISRKTARNALLPSLSLVGFYGGTGLAGELNPFYQGPNASTVPTDFGGALQNAFNNSSPDYYVGFNLNIPIRNRVAKADQYRSELEYRQSALRVEQLKKQIRIEVRNAQYALEQSRARVESARKARDLASRTFDITKKEQELGAGSSYQTLTAQRDLALAELDLVNAMTAYQKAKVELDRATGTTLEHNGMQIQDAHERNCQRRSALTANANLCSNRSGRVFRRWPARSTTGRRAYWRPTISSTFSTPSNCCFVPRATTSRRCVRRRWSARRWPRTPTTPCSSTSTTRATPRRARRPRSALRNRLARTAASRSS